METAPHNNAANDGVNRADVINRIWKRNDSIYANVAQRVHLPASVFEVLYALSLTDGLTQKEICDMSYSSKQTIHSAVIRLRDEGNLSMERGTGRSVRLRLTPKGQVLAARTVVPVIEAERATLATLSDEEFASLVRTLNELNDTLADRFEALSF